MNRCAVLRCEKPGITPLASAESKRRWLICVRHYDSVLAGASWGPTEDGKQILIGLLMPPHMVRWSVQKATDLGVAVTIETSTDDKNARPFRVFLTIEQAHQIAASLITSGISKSVPQVNTGTRHPDWSPDPSAVANSDGRGGKAEDVAVLREGAGQLDRAKVLTP